MRGTRIRDSVIVADAESAIGALSARNATS